MRNPRKSGVSSFRRSSTTSPHLASGGPMGGQFSRKSRPFMVRKRLGPRIDPEDGGQPLGQVSSGAGDAQNDFFGRPREISTPGHHANFVIPQFERGRQVDR